MGNEDVINGLMKFYEATVDAINSYKKIIDSNEKHNCLKSISEKWLNFD